MPDPQIRTWTLYEYHDGHVESVRFNLSQPAVRVVEWDRERVVPTIEQAQHEWATHFAAGGTRPLSDFIFDALNENNETKEDA